MALIGTNVIRVYDTSGNKITVSDAELARLFDQVASVTTTGTPASGSCGVQFVFKNAQGDVITSKRAMLGFMSDVNGAPVTAITSVAALTNGSVDTLVTGKQATCITSAAGLLGITFTGSAATRYFTFVMADGTLLTSAAIVIN